MRGRPPGRVPDQREGARTRSDLPSGPRLGRARGRLPGGPRRLPPRHRRGRGTRPAVRRRPGPGRRRAPYRRAPHRRGRRTVRASRSDHTEDDHGRPAQATRTDPFQGRPARPGRGRPVREGPRRRGPGDGEAEADEGEPALGAGRAGQARHRGVRLRRDGPRADLRRGQGHAYPCDLGERDHDRREVPRTPRLGAAETARHPSRPGSEGAATATAVEAIRPWSVTHQHGGYTDGGSDGWTDDAVYTGRAQLSEYANDQPGTLLWYHDHAMGITRWNVFAGLFGAYILRDEDDEALTPTSGADGGTVHEVPLILGDRNLETTDGRPGSPPTAQLLHKVVALADGPATGTGSDGVDPDDPPPGRPRSPSPGPTRRSTGGSGRTWRWSGAGTASGSSTGPTPAPTRWACSRRTAAAT
ncbi:multicopper oxidase domain-containing protein [Nocardiopsis sp. ARC36]